MKLNTTTRVSILGRFKSYIEHYNCFERECQAAMRDQNPDDMPSDLTLRRMMMNRHSNITAYGMDTLKPLARYDSNRPSPTIDELFLSGKANGIVR